MTAISTSESRWHPDGDCYEYALKQPSGLKASLAVESLRQTIQQWGSLDGARRGSFFRELEGIVSGADPSDGFAGIVLADWYLYFARCAEDWTLRNLLPFFEFGEPFFLCAWHRLLTSKSLYPDTFGMPWETLAAALPHVVEDSVHDDRGQFARFYAAALVRNVGANKLDYAETFISNATDEMKCTFAFTASQEFRLLKPDERCDSWQEWIKNYWSGRNSGFPCQIGPDEAGMMLRWAVSLPEVFPEASRLARDMVVLGCVPATIWREITDHQVSLHYPDEVAAFVLRFTRSEGRPMPDYGLQLLIEQLLGADVREQLANGLRDLNRRLVGVGS